MPSNLSHIQLFSTGLKTPLPPRPTKPSSRPSFSTSVKHRTRSIPAPFLNRRRTRKFYGGSIRISGRSLGNYQESGIVSSNTFFRWQLHRFVRVLFYFFFSPEESLRKETRDFKTIKRTRPKKRDCKQD